MISFKIPPVRNNILRFSRLHGLYRRYILYLFHFIQLQQLPSDIAKVKKYPVTECEHRGQIQLDAQLVPDESEKRRQKGVAKKAGQKYLNIEFAVQEAEKPPRTESSAARIATAA